MSDLPGHLAWHAPLALLAPGMWLLASAVTTVVLPTGRGRTCCAWISVAVAAVVAAAGWRASLVLALGTGGGPGPLVGWQHELLGGWVHAGFPWLVGAAVVAGLMGWAMRRQSWPVCLLAIGVSHLLVVGLIWWAQMIAAVILMGWWRWSSRARSIASDTPDADDRPYNFQMSMATAILGIVGLLTGVLHLAGV